MNDREIIALYFARAEEAIYETAMRYGHYCYSIAHNILSNREDSEECVNDTYLSAWNAIPPHRPERLDTFLGKITRNLALKRWESAHAQERGSGPIALALDELSDCLPDQKNTLDGAMDEVLLSSLLNSFLSSLPVATRRVFLLRYWYLYSIKAIAKETRAGESKIKMILLRTRHELKIFLEKEGVML